MDDLKDLILSLTEDEVKEFRRYLIRKRMPKNRKDIDLFNLYISKIALSKDAIFEKLYPKEKDKNPYHSLRKRLFKNLHDFLYLKQIDYSLQANLNKTISLIRHCFNHGLHNLAWKEIRKLESQAQRDENYHILKNLYGLAISNYNSNFSSDSLDVYLKNQREAARLVSDEENLQVIASVIKQELNIIIQSGKDADLQKLVTSLLRDFGLNERVYEHPRLLYNFILLMRDVTLSRKRYYEFEPFLMANLRLLDDQEYLILKPYFGLNVYYMAAHTLYRNKKFDESLTYLEKMANFLDPSKKAAYQKFYPKYILLKAACKNFTNNLQNSIDLLGDLLTNDWLDTSSLLNARLNLSVYLFQQEKYKLANKTLLDMAHTDKWYEKIMGVEWRLKKNMLEVFYQYELENFDLAFDRISSIERIFSELLKQPKYERAGIFLKLIRQIIQHPDLIGTDGFLERIEGSFDWKEKVEEEDLQAMAYYSWLKAKNIQKPYYLTQLEILADQ